MTVKQVKKQDVATADDKEEITAEDEVSNTAQKRLDIVLQASSCAVAHMHICNPPVRCKGGFFTPGFAAPSACAADAAAALMWSFAEV